MLQNTIGVIVHHTRNKSHFGTLSPHFLWFSLKVMRHWMKWWIGERITLSHTKIISNTPLAIMLQKSSDWTFLKNTNARPPKLYQNVVFLSLPRNRSHASPHARPNYTLRFAHQTEMRLAFDYLLSRCFHKT